MKVRYFIFLTLAIGVVSEFVHPNIQTWVPVSLATYIICGLFTALAIYFRKKDQKKFIGAIIWGVVTFTEYAVITAIAYLRMADTIIAKGPIYIIATIVVIIIFAIIAFWEDVKRLIQTK